MREQLEPITFKGKEYSDVESAYQQNKSTKSGDAKDNEDMELMTELITLKFEANQWLVDEINDKGGVQFLDTVTHQISKAGSRWETNGKNMFQDALIAGFNQATKVPFDVEPEVKPEPKVNKSKTPEFDKLPEHKDGQANMTYAGVGSRNTPPEVLKQMEELAKDLNAYGYTLQSGGAKGADTAFEKGAGNKKEIFYANDATDTTKAIAKEIHPMPSALSEYPVKLMARNTNQVFGKNLDTPVDFVLAYTPDGITDGKDRTIKSGGTGQAIDYASRKGIPVINLANPDWKKQLDTILRTRKIPKRKSEPVVVMAGPEPIDVKSPDGVTWNEQQNNAIVDIATWFKKPNTNFYSLQGKAGTGKTSVAKEVIRQYRVQNPGSPVAVLATSHEAKKVIDASMKGADLGQGDTKFFSVASALGMQPDNDGEFVQKEEPPIQGIG